MQDTSIAERLRALDRPRGSEERVLRIGEWRLRIHGLDRVLGTALDRRWGGFLTPEDAVTPDCSVLALRGGNERWLEQSPPGEPYRVEAAIEAGRPLVHSYHFAACPEGNDASWRVAITDTGAEPAERTLENAVRYLVARLAVQRGGFALHASGVLRDGRAFLFAGGSRAGKSTAVELSVPLASMGDDFGVVVPVDGAWMAPAVPFDNSERAPASPPRGWFPLAGVWRLYQAAEDRIESPRHTFAAASLLACVAFPWALPDLASALLRQVEGYVAAGGFAHLHFRKSADFWKRIDEIRSRV